MGCIHYDVTTSYNAVCIIINRRHIILPVTDCHGRRYHSNRFNCSVAEATANVRDIVLSLTTNKDRQRKDGDSVDEFLAMEHLSHNVAIATQVIGPNVRWREIVYIFIN